MEMIQAAGVGFLVCLLYLLLKKDQPALALLLVLAGNLTVIFLVVQQLAPLLEWMHGLGDAVRQESFSCLLKALGIALIAQFSQSLCKDAGTQSLAAGVELGARVLIMLSALPLLKNILTILTGWLV